METAKGRAKQVMAPDGADERLQTDREPTNSDQKETHDVYLRDVPKQFPFPGV